MATLYQPQHQQRRCPSPKRIAIFDLDRTLTRYGTYSPFLIFAASRLNPVRLANLPWVGLAMAGYKLGLISRSRLKELMQRAMIGASIDTKALETIVPAFAERMMRRGIYPGAIAQIASERASGALIVIASAAHHFYLDQLSLALDADHAIGTRSIFENHRLTCRIAGENCYGEEKRRRIFDWLDQIEWDARQTDICFYSDDISDAPSFWLSNERFAVNPSRSLRQLALRENWPILNWKE
jgi:HAD superfamily hydrolase (TIGR01490 family)